MTADDGRDTPTPATAALERRVEELERLRAQWEGATAELRQSRDWYKKLYEANPAMCFAVDRHGKVLSVNPFGADQLGYTVAELEGKQVTTIFLEEDREEIGRQLAECFANPGAIAAWEGRKVRKNGEVLWVRELADVVGGDDEPLALVVCEDVTPLKEAELALAQSREELEQRVEEQTGKLREQYLALGRSEAQLRSLVEDQTEFIVRWLPDGTRTYVNEAYCRYFGATRDEILGTSFIPLILPEYQEAVRRKIASLTRERPVARDEHRVVKADGTFGWNEWTDRAIFDDAGRVIELHSVGRDITERKEAEEELRRSEGRYRLLADNASDVIWVMDFDRRLTYVSPSVERLLGWTSDECLERPIEDLLVPESFAEAMPVLDEDLRSSRYVEVEPYRYRSLDIQLHHKNGDRVWTETRMSFLPGPDGLPEAILGISRDLTAWKKAQEALAESEERLRQSQRLESVGRLAGGVAHDFNNLLVAITGFSELAMRSLDDDHPTQADLRQIRDAGQRAAALTRQLLAFSRRQVLQPQVLDLNKVIADFEKLLRRTIGEDVELVIRLEPELWRTQADPGQIEQVLMNLVVNARDAMPGGGTLVIETHNAEVDEGFVREHPGAEPGPHVQVSVADSGGGIDEATQSRIFDPFFTTKPEGEGTGLGLATVYGIVKQSGGTISVESEEGRGATFSVYLPRIDEVGEKSGALDEPRREAGGGETVLVVEDDAAVRGLTERVLGGRGYTVICAAEGETALGVLAARGGEIALVLTDVVLPGMSGLDLAQQVAETAPGVRVLLVSGYSERTRLGSDGLAQKLPFLSKPFTPDELLRRVREALDAS